MAQQVAHSFSGFELFETCPKRYYHLKVAKDLKEEDGTASAAGTRDHSYFEHRLKDGTPLPPHLLRHEDKLSIIANSGFIVRPEEEFAINKRLEPVGWWDKDVFLRVKADVGLYGKRTAGLLDWKTGKRRPKNFQLELGALTQFIHYPEIKSTKAAFLWLRDDTADFVSLDRDDDYDRILNKLMTKADRIDEAVDEGVWQAKPGYHCNWCGLKDTCVSSRATR